LEPANDGGASRPAAAGGSEQRVIKKKQSKALPFQRQASSTPAALALGEGEPDDRAAASAPTPKASSSAAAPAPAGVLPERPHPAADSVLAANPAASPPLAAAAPAVLPSNDDKVPESVLSESEKSPEQMLQELEAAWTTIDNDLERLLLRLETTHRALAQVKCTLRRVGAAVAHTLTVPACHRSAFAHANRSAGGCSKPRRNRLLPPKLYVDSKSCAVSAQSKLTIALRIFMSRWGSRR